MTSVADRASFDMVRYASVWEDADVLCEALGPVARSGRLLSIASAGDNTLALLTLDPSEVVAVDLSGAQLACVEIRKAAFLRLDYPRVLNFLGVTPSSDRPAVYRRLRHDLTPDARDFWDARPGDVAAGVIHAGRFERYLTLFRRRLLPLIHSKSTVRALLALRSQQERIHFYDQVWSNVRWRLLMRSFFNRIVMARLGRAPSFFMDRRTKVGAEILKRTRHAMTHASAHENPFLVYALTGNYAPGALPRYLRPEHFEVIRARLGRLHLFRGLVEDLSDTRFDGFNLSDIFEYMTPEEHHKCYGRLVSGASDRARLVYWNLFSPRGRPAPEAGRVRTLKTLAHDLHRRDHAWFYQTLHVDEVISQGEGNHALAPTLIARSVA